MDFHENSNSNDCTRGPKTTLQLRSHVFAPQHGGTRALEELKKMLNIRKSTHNFKLYFPIYFPLSWNTSVVGFQLQAERTSKQENCDSVHLKSGKPTVVQNKALEREMTRCKAGSPISGAHVEWEALGGLHATGLSWHIPALTWQGVECL